MYVCAAMLAPVGGVLGKGISKRRYCNAFLLSLKLAPPPPLQTTIRPKPPPYTWRRKTKRDRKEDAIVAVLACIGMGVDPILSKAKSAGRFLLFLYHG